MCVCVWACVSSPSGAVPCEATGCFPFSLSLHAESSCCFPLFMALHLSFNSTLCLLLHTSLCQCFPSLWLRNLPHLLLAPLLHGGKSLYSFVHFFSLTPSIYATLCFLSPVLSEWSSAVGNPFTQLVWLMQSIKFAVFTAFWTEA